MIFVLSIILATGFIEYVLLLKIRLKIHSHLIFCKLFCLQAAKTEPGLITA
jgi:hypothetical protein